VRRTHAFDSLDTLDPFKFEIMTRRMGHDAVLRALDMALASPALETKLNAVVVKGLNDHEVHDFVALTKDKPLSVRFIEFMPFTGPFAFFTSLGKALTACSGNKWDSGKMVPSATLLQQITERFPGVMKAADSLNDTARSYHVPGHMGSFGFISSMSDHFCASCNRLRITADGQIKVCLRCPSAAVVVLNCAARSACSTRRKFRCATACAPDTQTRSSFRSSGPP
jgi:molybdenum cofactor biosynthesis enzyme MoaA